jgi:hypothetical protein
MRRVLSFAALSLMAVAATASAQRTTRSTNTASANPSPELGVDAGVMFTLDDPRVTAFQVPIQGIRMGFFVSPAISIEPSIRLNTVSVSGAGSDTDYRIGVGLLYHFAPNRAANQMYVRPFIGFSDDTGIDSGLDFGAGFGVKIPIANRFASRFEANLTHFSNDGNTWNALGLLAGLSVYTR